jgi:hypothetical protein
LIPRQKCNENSCLLNDAIDGSCGAFVGTFVIWRFTPVLGLLLCARRAEPISTKIIPLLRGAASILHVCYVGQPSLAIILVDLQLLMIVYVAYTAGFVSHACM